MRNREKKISGLEGVTYEQAKNRLLMYWKLMVVYECFWLLHVGTREAECG